MIKLPTLFPFKPTIAISAILLGLAGCSQVRSDDQSQQEWLTHGGNYAEQRFANAALINTDNVSELSLAWYVDLDTSRGQEATPLIIDGVLYTTTAWSKALAVNAVTGEVLWKFDPQVPGSAGLRACCDVVNRGLAYSDGKLFLGTLDGRLIALDKDSGEPLWSTMTVDPEQDYTITGAPRTAKGLVFIGNGGAEYGVRGYVSAYDEQTGDLKWRFYTVPGKPGVADGAASDSILEELARPTWFGDVYHQTGGGGTVWDSIVYDEELDQLYIGVGNGSPWNHQIRSQGQGDNLFVSSVLALDPDTGEYLWHYQETPGESWDFTATQQMVLDTLEIEGEDRQVIMHAPKNGFFYVIDRSNGELISAEKFADANWASHYDMETGRPVEHPNARFTDGPFLATVSATGAHNWNPMAYDPNRRVMYIPAQQMPMAYSSTETFEFQRGQWNIGVNMGGGPPPEGAAPPPAVAPPPPMPVIASWLSAWDPIAQEEVWRVPHEGLGNGGILATAGDLVFQGLADGNFHAFDANDGRDLWQFDAQTVTIAGPVSYVIDGQQFIVVMAGNGGVMGMSAGGPDGPAARQNGRILAFAIGGEAQLPEQQGALAPLNPGEGDWSDAQLANGAAKYGLVCGNCHGPGTVASGVIPDLKRAASLSSEDAWRAIVIDGALEGNGMVSFADQISVQDAEDIRGYVSQMASMPPPPAMP